MVLTLRAIAKTDHQLYQSLYQNKEVMQYVCVPLDDASCGRSFELLIEKVKDGSKRKCMVIEAGGLAIGLVDAKHKGSGFGVEVGVLMLPEFHGKGLAKAAHLLLFEKLESQNWPQCFRAFCSPDNLTANHLYQSLGFKKSKDKNNKTTAWERK